MVIPFTVREIGSDMSP